jgi:hypothetical protein
MQRPDPLNRRSLFVCEISCTPARHAADGCRRIVLLTINFEPMHAIIEWKFTQGYQKMNVNTPVSLTILR